MSKKTNHKYSVGVDLGGTNVRAGLIAQNKLIRFEGQRVRSHGSQQEVFTDLCTVIDKVFDKKVTGIGLGVPSLVDPDKGIIQDTTNIKSWKMVPLKKWLEKKYKVPVAINNDAKCFALGEKKFGHAKACENFVGMIIGTGLGCGIISRGRLVTGEFCGAGEFGIMPYRDSILEHYASGQFFQKFGTNGAQLHLDAQSGDPKAKEIFQEYGQHLAHAFKIVLLALAPEMIVLGGSVSQSYEFFQKSLKDSLEDFAYPFLSRQLKIKVSKVKNVAILGASSLLADQSAL